MSVVDAVQISETDGALFVFSGCSHVRCEPGGGSVRAHIHVTPGAPDSYLELHALGETVDDLMAHVARMFNQCNHDQSEGIDLATVREMAEAVTDPNIKPGEPAGDDS